MSKLIQNALQPIAWDCETFQFSPGNMAPRIVCLSYALDGYEPGLLNREGASAWLKELLANDAVLFIGHNVAYDFGVAMATFPELTDAIFRAYELNRVTDTNVREKLIRIAHGTHFKNADYSLAELSLHYHKVDRSKSKEAGAWRTRFSELDATPVDMYPIDAKQYAIDDSTDALSFFHHQEEHLGLLDDQFRQTRKDFWLHLTEVWGITTDIKRVAALDERVRTRYTELRYWLLQNKMIRKKVTNKRPTEERPGSWIETEYVRNVKDARALMYWLFEQGIIEPVLTDSAKKRRRKLKREGRKTPGFQLPPITVDDCALSSEAGEKIAHPLCTKEGCGKADCDDLSHKYCGQYGCNICRMTAYCEYSGLTKYISTDLIFLWQGTQAPIHATFDGLKETGRSGCSKPNLQNQKRSGGVRECFIPRPGHVFAVCDYDGLELRTMAQVCMSTFGYSMLADALNKGDDPHLRPAAALLGVSYEQALGLRKSGDAKVEDARQCGKIANFGFPGGLGVDALVDYAWTMYRMKMDLKLARKLKHIWLQTFPEFKQYFDWIGTHIVNGKGSFKHLFSNRTRGGIGFTQCCNTPFQGLGGDCTGAAGWEIAKACYVDTQSPLYGSRIVNYIHDEFMLETPDTDNAPIAAAELSRLMCVAANRFLPDVPATATPLLCRRWSKYAKVVKNDQGVLITWDDERQSS